ncbi:DUF4124 domain-containing protein [Xanthomonas vasicola]|uniref:DUF4124 domain-containing protein n=1 Tax=Xanthomonas vasicola TaxID=56459 RepID=UPI001D0C5FBB|nr:DUF4124 domain-containing protein [Xanthomonas vasicola]
MEARFAILLALAIAVPSHAQQVHKCRERGQVVYQSAPCASGQAEKSWDAAPAPEQSNAEQWRLYGIRKQLESLHPLPRMCLAHNPATHASLPRLSASKSMKRLVSIALMRCPAIGTTWCKTPVGDLGCRGIAPTDNASPAP